MLPEETLTKMRGVLAQYPVKRARLFGSQARGDARPGSDIDLLVDLHDHDDAGMDLLELIGLEQQLCDATGQPVQLTCAPVSQRLWHYIHDDLQPLYVERQPRLSG